MIRSFLLTLLVTAFLVPLRLEQGPGVGVSSLAAVPAYFWVTLHCLKCYAASSTGLRVLSVLLTSQSVLLLGAIVGFFQGDTWFLPHFVIQQAATISGYFFWKVRTAIGIIPLGVSVLFAVFMYSVGYDYWLHYRNFDTFTGRIDPYFNEIPISGLNGNLRSVPASRTQGRIVLLDFWTTSCGICFQKFPLLESFYKRWEADESILIFAVNDRLEEDSEATILGSISSRGYSFPVLLPFDGDMAEKFGVKKYPTTLLINRDGTVIYRGSLEGAVSTAEALLSGDL